jgi:DNA-binding transcriptional ArsR family regulator
MNNEKGYQKMTKDYEKILKQMRNDLKILADGNRLEILRFLKKKKEAPVCTISDNIGASFKATSKHLLFLARKGILKRRYDSPFVLYKFSNTLSEIHRIVISHL